MKISSFLALAALILVCGNPFSAHASEKPNVIIIWTDDQGYADVSIHGNKDYQTPNIDSLALNGVRCTDGYVSQPQCSHCTDRTTAIPTRLHCAVRAIKQPRHRCCRPRATPDFIATSSPARDGTALPPAGA